MFWWKTHLVLHILSGSKELVKEFVMAYLVILEWCLGYSIFIVDNH